jgi:uncharacterized protein YkwD
LDKNLEIKIRKLIWNNTLASVAEAKAYDMAKRNYFDHIDPGGYGINYYINKAGYKLNAEWTQDKSDNSFESIVAGPEDGQAALKTLIMDNGVTSFGHRDHLLGIGDWNASLTDIGIGFARRDTGSDYTTYVSIIIAKHNW